MSQLLNTKQAANYLGVSTAFLERDRWAGARIPFVRLGVLSITVRIDREFEEPETKLVQ